MLQQKRIQERELNAKKQELERKTAERALEVEKMRQETTLMENQEQEARQQVQQMRVMAQRQEQIDRQRRNNMANLEYIHEQALDYVLNYYPHEDEFKEAAQGHSWGVNTSDMRSLLSVRQWFGNGVRFDISKFWGVERASKSRIIGDDINRYWTYWASRQLSIVISYVGSGFLSLEQLKQRIKERIRDGNIFG